MNAACSACKEAGKARNDIETPKIPNEQLLILWLLTSLSQIKMKTLRKDVELD